MTLITHGVEEVDEEFRFIKSHTGFKYVFVHPGFEFGLEDGQTFAVLSVSSDSVLVQDGEEKEHTNAFDYAYGELLTPHQFVKGECSFLPGPGPYHIGECLSCQKENQPLASPGQVCATYCTPLRDMNAYYSIKGVT